MEANKEYQQRRHELELAKANQDPLREAIANFIDVIRWLLIGVAILAALVLFGYVKEAKDISCNSPCTVKFQKGTQDGDIHTRWIVGGKLRVTSDNDR